jgi:hypothetical protein
MDYDEMDEDEFITEMENSDRYKGIFDIMVRGRWLFYLVQRMPGRFAYSRVAGNLLQSQTGLSWNNEANRERIIRYEARDIIQLLEGLGRFHPSERDEEEADTLIISLNNALANLYPPIHNNNLNPRLDNNGIPIQNNGIGGFRKRKRKSIKTKSKKSKKSKKTRKSRK